MTRRLKIWREAFAFGTENPERKIAVLAALGLATGVAEVAIVLLIVALASGGESRLPLDGVFPDSTWSLAAISIAVLIPLALGHLGSAWLSARVAAEAQHTVQDLLVTHFLNASWSAQAASRVGELQEFVGGRTMQLAQGTLEASRMVATSLNLLVLVLAALLVDPWIAVALLVAVALTFAVALPLRSYRRRVMRETAQAATGLALEVTETAGLARELRVFGATQAANERLTVRIEAASRLLRASRFVSGVSGPLTRDVTLALLVLILAIVAESTNISLAALGASVILLLRALSHGQSLITVGTLLEERKVNIDLVRERLAAWTDQVAPGTREIEKVECIALADVTYSYPGSSRAAVDGLNLRLERGEQLAVVGPTGAGKSTLAGLLLGLLRPDAGQVLIDDVPLQTIAPGAWARNAAWLGQDPVLLTGTVAENIRLLRSGLDDSDVARAASAAGLDKEIDEWPDGLDHHVGPAGRNLSGGQRQRVALARALAAGPALLVLDEPTSAQDPHSEAAIREVLTELRGEVTVVLIAHRLSTIRSADRVLLLDEGRAVALGPHSQVMAENPWFREALEHSATG